MDFTQARQSCFDKYATFAGRAPRSEFWFFQLNLLLGYVVLVVLGLILGFLLGNAGAIISTILFVVYALGLLLPALSVLVRRLHDTDRSGWFYWIGLIPLVGPILLLVWFCSAGTSGGNRFGGDPLVGL